MKTPQIDLIKKNSLVFICQNLPYEKTILEENGFCQETNPSCKYYETKTSICKKKTYTPTKSLLEYFTD